MQIDILTIFPSMFSGFLDESLMQRAKEKNLVRIRIHNIRDFTEDKHKTVDDTPFGGGGDGDEAGAVTQSHRIIVQTG